MELFEMRKNDWVVLEPKGKLDAQTQGMLQERVNALIARGARRILLDCASLDYVSSGGLRALFDAAFRLNAAGGRLACCGVNANVLRTFKAVDLPAEIGLFATAEEALQ
jgi:anti-anti-sigma factor